MIEELSRSFILWQELAGVGARSRQKSLSDIWMFIPLQTCGFSYLHQGNRTVCEVVPADPSSPCRRQNPVRAPVLSHMLHKNVIMDFFFFFLWCLFAEEIKLTHLEGHVSLQGLCVAKSSWLWSISKTLCCPAVLLISELVTHSWVLLEACGLWQTNNTVWIKQAFYSLHHHYFCITRMLWRQNPQVSDPQMPDPALELKCWP